MTWDQLMDDLAAWAQDPVAIAIAAGIVLLLVLLVVYLVRRRRRRRRTETFERRFGDEYDRTVESSTRRRAEDDLEHRRERHREMKLRWLSPSEREEFRARFESVQASFVDTPDSAVLAADGLIDEVAIARGYPEETDRSRRLSDVSVDYPDEVAGPRRALAELAGDDDRPTTEQQRKALLAARTLFDRLVGVGDGTAVPEPPAPLATAGTDATDAMDDEDEIVVVDQEPERERQTVPHSGERRERSGGSGGDDERRPDAGRDGDRIGGRGRRQDRPPTA